jgi:hypothetical protein
MSDPSELFPILLALIAAGLSAGLIAGLLGVGGGIALVPVLDLALPHAGVPVAWSMHVAVATSLASIVPTGDFLLACPPRPWRRRLVFGPRLGTGHGARRARRQPVAARARSCNLERGVRLRRAARCAQNVATARRMAAGEHHPRGRAATPSRP